jgi:hypothetical protein
MKASTYAKRGANPTIVPAKKRVAWGHKRREVKLLKTKGKIFELNSG